MRRAAVGPQPVLTRPDVIGIAAVRRDKASGRVREAHDQIAPLRLIGVERGKCLHDGAHLGIRRRGLRLPILEGEAVADVEMQGISERLAHQCPERVLGVSDLPIPQR